MNKDKWFLLVFLIWLGLITLSVATGHFNVPEELRSSWHHFTIVTTTEKLKGIAAIIVLAIPVTIVSFLVGPILLPLEIVVFPILAAVTINGFWLTMFIIWKYVLLFTIVF